MMLLIFQGEKALQTKNKTFTSTIKNGKNPIEYSKTNEKGYTKTIENTSDRTIIVTKYKNNGDKLEITSVKMSNSGKYN